MNNQQGFVFVHLLLFLVASTSLATFSFMTVLERWKEVQFECRKTVLLALDQPDHSFSLIKNFRNFLNEKNGTLTTLSTRHLKWKVSYLESDFLEGECQVDQRKENNQWISYIKTDKF